MGLEKYQRMRDFGQTPEPRGKATRAKKRKPTFVVQKHRASHLHYDFRLEMEGVLKSWAVPKGPSYDAGIRRLAMMTEDHPYEYGSFEGVIPAGNYGAGNVIIWDNGEWEFLGPGKDPVAAVREGKLTFRLHGQKLHGEWALVRIAREKGNEWLLLKHRDEWASSEVDVTEVAPLSVVSGLSVEEVGSETQWESNRKTGGVRTEADAARARLPGKSTAKKSGASRASPAKKSRASGTASARAGASKEKKSAKTGATKARKSSPAKKRSVKSNQTA